MPTIKPHHTHPSVRLLRLLLLLLPSSFASRGSRTAQAWSVMLQQVVWWGSASPCGESAAEGARRDDGSHTAVRLYYIGLRLLYFSHVLRHQNFSY
jgi:hypothetical protein